MDSVDYVTTLRYYMASDSKLQAIFGLTEEELLGRMYFQDTGFTNAQASGSQTVKYPCISILEEEESPPNGIPTSSVTLYIIVHNSIRNDNVVEVLLKIKDRLRLLFRDKHEDINSKSRSLNPPLNLKVRNSQWVSGVHYQDKELGTERLHKIINTLQMIVGD